MKIWKKISLGLFTLTSVTILLAACGSENNETEAGNTAENTIRFSWWGNDDRHQVTLDAIDLFEEKDSEVTVKAEYSGFGNLEEQITTQLAGGTEADVMTILYDWVSKFSPQGDGFYDLEEFTDVIDLSQFDEDFLEFGYSNGKLQAIPYGENVMTVATNKTVFDELGLEIPTTWEGYKEVAKEFPEGSFPLVSPTPRFAATIYLQQKTGKTEFDDEGNMNYTEEDYKDAVEWYKDLVDAKVFASRQDYLENVGSEPVSLAQNAKFINGEYAGVLEWNGALASYEATLEESGNELVLSPMPTIENAKTEGSISKPTMLFAISKNTENPEKAAEFISFLLNDPEGIKTLGVSRGIPASKIAVETLMEDGQMDGIVKEASDYGQEVGKLNETSFYEDGTLTAIYQTQMENYELGQSTLEEVSHALYEQTKEQAEELVEDRQ